MEPLLSLGLRNVGSPDYTSSKMNKNLDTNHFGFSAKTDQIVSVRIAS